jgi:hypothetical protein
MRGYLDWGEIAKKSRIKASVRAERKVNDDYPPHHATTIPIALRDGDPRLFFPATPDDVANILEALPPGTLDALGGVILAAGTRYVNAHAPGGTPDPYLGRVGFEFAPGVWLPSILGTYDRESMTIHLYGYVKAPDAILSREQSVELILRMLRTLVHEVAHHQDRTQRVARGRWRMDDTERDERYADLMTRRWCYEVIVPYLAARFREPEPESTTKSTKAR